MIKKTDVIAILAIAAPIAAVTIFLSAGGLGLLYPADREARSRDIKAHKLPLNISKEEAIKELGEPYDSVASKDARYELLRYSGPMLDASMLHVIIDNKTNRVIEISHGEDWAGRRSEDFPKEAIEWDDPNYRRT